MPTPGRIRGRRSARPRQRTPGPAAADQGRCSPGRFAARCVRRCSREPFSGLADHERLAVTGTVLVDTPGRAVGRSGTRHRVHLGSAADVSQFGLHTGFNCPNQDERRRRTNGASGEERRGPPGRPGPGGMLPRHPDDAPTQRGHPGLAPGQFSPPEAEPLAVAAAGRKAVA
jgi:hypothetical protein